MRTCFRPRSLGFAIALHATVSAFAGTTTGKVRLGTGHGSQRELCFSVPTTGEIRFSVALDDPNAEFYAMLVGGHSVARATFQGRGALSNSYVVDASMLSSQGSVWAIVLQPAAGRSSARGRIEVTTPSGVLRGENEVDSWLLDHPNVTHHLRWTDASGTYSYGAWPQERKQALWDACSAIRSGRDLALPDPPRNAWRASAGDSQSGVHMLLSPEDARSLHLASVAQSLALELDRGVPWSLAGYSDDALEALLAASSQFWWNAHQGGYEPAAPTSTYVIPPPPQFAFEFLRDRGALRGNARETIVALTEFCRSLVHMKGGLELADFEDQWDYSGAMPITRALRGTTRRSDGWRARFTAGCHGTVGIMVSVLRSANVPAQGRIVEGHATIEFLSEDLALTHGDDPYNRISVRASTEELFIDRATYDAWLGPLVDTTNSIGRKTIQLGLRYGAPCLVDEYRRDREEGRSRANGRVLDAFRTVYTLAELEGAGLYERLDAELAAGVTEAAPVPLGEETMAVAHGSATRASTTSSPTVRGDESALELATQRAANDDPLRAEEEKAKAGIAAQNEAIAFELAQKRAVHAEPSALERPSANVLTIEGENLRAVVNAGQVMTQPMSGFPDGSWSGQSQLWWTGVTVKSQLTATFEVKEAGTYRLRARFTKAPDYGRFWILVDDGMTKAGELDLYDPRVTVTDSILLGEFEFRTGEHRFGALNIGQNEKASPGSMFGLDALELERVRE